MNSRSLFMALFCVYAAGGCHGEAESSSLLSTSTSNTTYWGRSPRYPQASHSYPSSHRRPLAYQERIPYAPTGSFDSSTSEENTTIWLKELQFITRTELNVDINLPRIAHTEQCSFITPDNRNVRVEKNNVAGVTTYGSSAYVSCRIVVGPMEESLLGKWTICGSYTENNVKHKRCQSANIAWRNKRNPSSVWHTITHAEFYHVVNYRNNLSPSVRGTGNVVSCHLITPNKEDLLVTRVSQYPYVRLVQDTDSVCSIAIGPIKDSHLGLWTIYGQFNSTLGFNEVRQPMNLDLFNKNRPYEQAYNVTTLNPIEYAVNYGESLSVEVANTGSINVCIFTMPSGMSYNTIDLGIPSGVEFIKGERIACELKIGPITQEMVGTWMLIGKFSDRDVHTQKIQWFNVTLEGNGKPGPKGTQRYFDTKPTFYDQGLNTTTVANISAVDDSHLYSKLQSDRVLVEIPVSLATDQDLHFAMSLVPMLRQRSLRDKLDAQMNILHFLKSNLPRNKK